MVDTFKPTAQDFEDLQQAEVQPKNKKQIIIDFIKRNGVPGPSPDLTLLHGDGIVVQDPFEQYLASKEYYSTGAFAKMANGTPLDFKYEVEEGTKQELERYKDKSHFELGSFTHEAILEPEKWETVVCEPAASRASHEGLNTLIDFWSNHADHPLPDPSAKTEAKKEWIAQAQFLSGLRSIDLKSAVIVAKLHERWNAYQNGLWAQILNAAQKEVSVYCGDYNGMPMRVRPDGLLFADQIGVNAIVSVKTTAAVTKGQYQRDVTKFGYDIKEASYQRIVSKVTGLDFSTTIMIVLSTSEPFNVGVFILSDSEMNFAKERFHTAIELAKICTEVGNFPGWEMYAGINELGIIDLEVY